MTLNHQNGEGSIGRLESFAPRILSEEPADLVLNAASISFCLVEIPVSEAIRVLPPALHPSIPGMVGCLHYTCSHEDLGDFDLVSIGVLCRSGIKPRIMTTSAFINNAEARDRLAGTWGFPLRMADIKLRINYDRVRSSVAIEDRTLLDFEVQNPQPLTGAGGSVRYPQYFNLATVNNALKFVQVDASYGFERVARGRPKISHCDAGLINNVDLDDAFPVAGTVVNTKITFHPVRYLADVNVSAENGGVVSLAKL